MALGKQVRFYRERLGLTLEQLSERSGVELGTISALEVRDSARSGFTAQLASALGVSLEALLGEGGHSAAVVLGEPAPPHWPFRASYAEYEALSREKKEQLETLVAAFLAGAAPIRAKPARKPRANP